MITRFRSLHTGWKTVIATVAAIGVLVGAIEAMGRIGLRPVVNGEFERRLVPVEEYVAESRCDRAQRRFYELDRQRQLYERKSQRPPTDLMDAWRYWGAQMQRYCRR